MGDDHARIGIEYERGEAPANLQENASGDYLARIGIEYERWETPANLPENASAEQVLNAYAPQIEELKRRGGYVTADVIDVKADPPGLDAMLAKLMIEHQQDEMEGRNTFEGGGSLIF